MDKKHPSSQAEAPSPVTPAAPVQPGDASPVATENIVRVEGVLDIDITKGGNGQLLDLTKGRDADLFDRSIDNHVSRLRKKIEPDPKNPRYIKTVWGGGYMFAVEPEAG